MRKTQSQLFNFVCYFFQLTQQKKFRFPLNQDKTSYHKNERNNRRNLRDRKMNRICVSFALISSLVFVVKQPNQVVSNGNPVIAVNAVGIGKFQIAVSNFSENPIYLGGHWSELGFDQFRFVIFDGKDEVNIDRDNMLISTEFFDVTQIKVGGFCLINVNLFDGTWDLGDAKKIGNNWKQVKVQYNPENCYAKRVRKEKNIYSKLIESSFVDIASDLGMVQEHLAKSRGTLAQQIMSGREKQDSNQEKKSEKKK